MIYERITCTLQEQIGDAVIISIQDLELLQKLESQLSIQITGQCLQLFPSSGPEWAHDPESLPEEIGIRMKSNLQFLWGTRICKMFTKVATFPHLMDRGAEDSSSQRKKK